MDVNHIIHYNTNNNNGNSDVIVVDNGLAGGELMVNPVPKYETNGGGGW